MNPHKSHQNKALQLAKKTLEKSSQWRADAPARRNLNPCKEQVITEVNRELSLQARGIETCTENQSRSREGNFACPESVFILRAIRQIGEARVSSAWERFDPCQRQNSAAKRADARKRIYRYNVTTGLLM
jgi:hypothetical protein